MSYAFHAHGRFNFHTNGNANRRDRDTQPRVLILDSAHDETGDFAGVVVHFSGDEFTRQVERHSTNADLIEGLSPEQAFELGRLVEGAEVMMQE
ncbi:hypothetical protein [Salinisphaera orenii]|uniref:hypothetical protein n=1 Tax=Salinisphaera orenii TaxID=856731 RepID=UPI000DBE7C85